MVKVAQHTKFDNTVQRESPARYNGPAQKLLFPEKEIGIFHDHYKEFEPLNQKLKPLDLEYPELKEEHIGTRDMNEREDKRVRDEISYYTEHAKDHPYTTPKYEAEAKELKQYLEDNKIQDVLKGKVLAKYEQLRAKSIEFYTVYQEANKIAVLEYKVNTEGTYKDLFKDFSKLVINEITRGIGILFGVHANKDVAELFDPFKNGINIFTIHSLNYQRKIAAMDKVIQAMDAILKDYNHRKKLLKGLAKNIDTEIQLFLSNPHWQTFLKWMDEYFPYHKDDFVQQAVKNINNFNPSAKEDFYSMRFGDLIKFKTFKSIYERSSAAATVGLKNIMQGTSESKIKEELANQITQRIVLRAKTILEFIASLSDSLSDEAKINSVITFSRKTYGIDLRALFTFTQNVNKKRNSVHMEEVKNTPAEIDEKGLAALNSNFYFKCFESLERNLKSLVQSEFKNRNPFLEVSVESYVKGLGAKKYNHFVDREGMQKALILNAKDFENLANHFIYNTMVISFPGFVKQYDIMRDHEGNFPVFGGIRNILEENEGKFSIEGFTNYAHQHIPFFPKELIFSYVRGLFKDLDHKSLNRLELLKGTHYQHAAKVLFNIMSANNKLEHNSFTKLFIMLPHWGSMYSRIYSDMPKGFTDENLVFVMSNAVRNMNTIEKDLENLEAFAKFIHNEAGNLNNEIVRKIVSNKNFINFTKVGIVRKLFKAYAQIQSAGGVEKIYETYGNIIDDLIERDFLSKDFKNNITKIQNFFESNQEISPKSEEFTALFESASKLESDLATIKMGDALKEMIQNYIPKDPKVFDLDLAINDQIRFRVLRDKDPRTMRIGIETDCCQRIGGAGEAAARDSFINPLSSVLILEWRNPEDPQDWLLLAQSYFHYVPNENGYILDNVESNNRNVTKFRIAHGMSLEELYALFAEEIKNKLNIKYLLSGKNYSKIEPSRFKTDKRTKDPRSFDARSLTPKYNEHYSDFDENNSINLLEPKFNLATSRSKLSRANEQIRGLIKAILNPSNFFKTAQQQIQDVRSIQGAKPILLGPRSWEYVNQFVNEMNKGFSELAGTQKLGNQPINFQTVVKNPTGETRFTGGIRSLFDLSMNLWQVVTANRQQPYSVGEARTIAESLLNKVNTSSFPEPAVQNTKARLTTILNNWIAILK